VSAKEDLERIEAKVDWCVAALKHLLKAGVVERGQTIGLEDDEYDDYLEFEEDVTEVPVSVNDQGDFVVPDFVVPHHAPRAPKRKACTHNMQGLVDGNIICQRCGAVLVNRTGVVQDRLSPAGDRIIQDPSNIRRPGEETHENESNPGGFLAPHSLT
jgi:hypothetical protein